MERHGGGYSRAEAQIKIARMTLEAVGELIELSVGVERRMHDDMMQVAV